MSKNKLIYKIQVGFVALKSNNVIYPVEVDWPQIGPHHIQCQYIAVFKSLLTYTCSLHFYSITENTRPLNKISHPSK